MTELYITSTDGTPLCWSCAHADQRFGCGVKNTGTACVVYACNRYVQTATNKKDVAK